MIYRRFDLGDAIGVAIFIGGALISAAVCLVVFLGFAVMIGGV